MRRKRTISIAAAVLLVIAGIVAAVLLRRGAAPEPARLLPEADAYAYVNLKPLRMAGVIGKTPVATPDADYEQFVRETGFEFERDLDEAAFAIHAPSRSTEGELRSAEQDQFRRYSEVFVGRIDSQRLSSYLRKLAKTVENYHGVDVYSIPLPGRTVRVALLGVGTAAASNTEDPQVIQGMIDRYRELALPFGGPTLIHEYYKEVPFGSSAWAITRISPGSSNDRLMLPGGFDLFLPGGTTLVASVRYLGSVHFRAEAFAATAAQAKQIADEVRAFLSIFRGLEASSSGTDPDVKALFNSLGVEENKNRAILTATVPAGFVKKLFSEPPPELTGVPVPTPEPDNKPQPPKHRAPRKRR